MLACLLLIGGLGCSGAKVDPAEVARQRSRLALADEPDDAQTVLDVRAVMYGKDPDELKAELQLTHDHEDGEDAGHSDESHEAAHDDDHGHAPPSEQKPAAEPTIKEMDVVIVGSVGGVPNPTSQSHPEFPFAKGEAMFFLADPEAAEEFAEHGHQHAPGEECAFCAAHAADSTELLAVVQFHDENGKVLSVDARDLFDLKEKETVVVRGKARIAPGGMLAIDATGLYVRR